MRRLIAPGKVAEYLATAGQKNKYKIAKGTGLSHGRVGDAVPRLVELDLVEGRRIGKARTGLPIMGYSLTIKGLAYVLLAKPDLWKSIDAIVAKNKKLLPLIFGKWKYFDQAGVKKFLVANLKDTLKAIATPLVIAGPDEFRWVDNKGIKEQVNKQIIWPSLFLESEVLAEKTRQAWVNAIANDPDLTSYVKDLIERKESLYSAMASFDKAAKKAIEQKRPKLIAKPDRFFKRKEKVRR